MEVRPLVVVGLMSGTSGDGIDSAIVRLPGKPDLRAAQAALHRYQPYSAAQREKIFGLFDTKRTTADVLCRLNFQLGEWFATAALDAIAAAGLKPQDVDLIGSPGQTVYHHPPGHVPVPARPDGAQLSGAQTGCTLQIGEPAVIVERTGITTVGDFRVRDVAAGGHGAPLVSYVDALLFRDPAVTRVVLNLGGIANITVLPPQSEADAAGPLAFDTGPGNMVLDWLTHRLSGGALAYDVDGRLAAGGRVDGDLLAGLLADPYFAAAPPKSTGREQYGAEYAERVFAQATRRGLVAQDVLATATALTAESISMGIRATAGASGGGGGQGQPLPQIEVIVGGGGTQNSALLAELGRRLPGVRLTTHEAYGVSSQAKEALSFAMLAATAVWGEANTLPSCTGAHDPVIMGKILPGANYGTLMRRLFAA